MTTEELEYLTCTPIVLELHGGSPFSAVFSGSGLRHLFSLEGWGFLSAHVSFYKVSPGVPMGLAKYPVYRSMMTLRAPMSIRFYPGSVSTMRPVCRSFDP